MGTSREDRVDETRLAFKYMGFPKSRDLQTPFLRLSQVGSVPRNTLWEMLLVAACQELVCVLSQEVP